MDRTDIHRPSAIIPSDYQEVAVWTMNIQGIGDAEFMLRERQIVREHMARTGGTHAHVDTTGSCQVCGNVQAIYLMLFYHTKSNTYLKVGFDCAMKLGMSGDEAKMNMFRRNVANAREAQAGKKKAIAILGDLGLMEAWEIYLREYPKHVTDCAEQGSVNGENTVSYACICDFTDRVRAFDQYEERTIHDIVSKLVKYGNISEKASAFVKNLLAKIIQRPIILAQRAAEAEAAAPVPNGRVIITGRVLSLKTIDRPTYHYGDSGISTKVLIQGLTGFKVWGNRFNNVDKGDLVTFTATVTPSDKDPKFGFFSRPTKAFFVNEQTGELLSDEVNSTREVTQ